MSIVNNLVKKYSQTIIPEISQQEIDELSGRNSPEGSSAEAVTDYILANGVATLDSIMQDFGLGFKELQILLTQIGEGIQLKYGKDPEGNATVKIANKGKNKMISNKGFRRIAQELGIENETEQQKGESMITEKQINWLEAMMIEYQEIIDKINRVDLSLANGRVTRFQHGLPAVMKEYNEVLEIYKKPASEWMKWRLDAFLKACKDHAINFYKMRDKVFF